MQAPRQRIGLVGCVKSKRDHPARAADLYTSALFTGRKRWVKATCDRWFVLSAKHGVLDPDEIVDPRGVPGRTGRRGPAAAPRQA